jgi:hypothetical protein
VTCEAQAQYNRPGRSASRAQSPGPALARRRRGAVARARRRPGGPGAGWPSSGAPARARELDQEHQAGRIIGSESWHDIGW